jgi:hypothetical protein
MRRSSPTGEIDSAMQDFAAAVSGQTAEQLAAGGDETTEWLCTQWPETSWEPRTP